MIQAHSLEDFAKLCEQALNDDFIFVGQVVITGLGKGKDGQPQFMYTQQWAYGAQEVLGEDEIQPDNTETPAEQGQ